MRVPGARTEHGYVEAFVQADRVVIGGVLQKTTDVVAAQDLFSPADLVADLRARDKPAWTAPSAAEIVTLLCAESQPGDVVVMMSNGDFGGLRARLQAALQTRPAAEQQKV